MKVVKGAVWGSALALALGCGALAWAEEEPVDTTLVAEEPAGEGTTDPADEGTPPKEEEGVEDPNLEDFPTVVDDTTEEEPVKEDPPADETTGEEPRGEQPEIVVLPVDDSGTWVPPPDMTPEEELIWMTMMQASGGPVEDVSDVSEAPEPATIMLVGLGGASLLGWGAWRRRKQKV